MSTAVMRRAAASVSLLVLAVLLLACAPSDPASMMAEARAARERGDARASVIMLKNLVQKDPAHKAARVLLGETYLEQGDPQSAEKELRRAQALGANGSPVTLLLGKALLMQGQYERVLADIHAADAPSQQAATMALRANALLGQGKVDAARALFNEALAGSADAPEPQLGLARIAVWEKQPARAHALIARALAAHPGNTDCLRFQADLLRAEGKAEAAMAAQQAILARHPHNAQALVDVANLHIDAGKMELARASLAAARRVSGPSIGLLYADAMLNFREHKTDEALDIVQRVLRAAPEHYPSVLLAGALQSAKGAHAQATQHLQQFLKVYPGHPYASKLLAGIHLAANQPDAVLAIVQPLLQEHANDVELLSLAGEAHLRARRHAEAATLFERASVLQPASASLHTGLALSRMGSGDHARAVTELERASSLGQDPSRTGILLVMGHLRARQPDQALKAVQQMEQRSDNPLVQNLKGGVHLARGDALAARASFERAIAMEPAYLPALSNLERLDGLEQRAGDSLVRYRAALQKSPRNVALMEALARLTLAAGRNSEALAWMEKAHNEQPAALPLALRAAALYLRAGDSGKALLLLRQLQTSHPADVDVLSLAGQAHAAARQFPEAAEAYAKLAAALPDAARPHVMLANVQLAQRQTEQAGASLRKALALDPDLLDARIMLVNLLLQQGKPDAALALGTALKKRHPDLAAGYKLEGDVLSAQGKLAAALLAYQHAFDKGPSGPALIQLSTVLSRLGRASEADTLISQWLREHPQDVPTRLHVASTKLVNNEPKAAIPHLEAVLKVEPSNLAALNDLAWSYQRVGDAQALALAKRAHALAPENPAVLDTLGWIHLERGDLARALPLLQKASRLAPNAPDIHYRYGVVLARSGDRAGARRALHKALAGPRFTRRDEANTLLKSL